MPIEGEYFYEDYADGAGNKFRIDELIFSGKTKYQEVLIFYNKLFEKVLVLDDVVQATTSDEFIYHEMLTLVPIFALNDVKNLLIVGGGDGGMLRHVLKHPHINPTIIDIDAELVEICKKHLAEFGQGAFDDPRTNYLSGDGFEYLKNSPEIFDLIIIDSTDPLGGPGDVLYSKPFFDACKSHLRPGGVVVTQSGVPFHERGRLKNLRRTLGEVFHDMRIYAASIPCFFGGAMSFGWGCDDPNIRKTPLDVITSRFKKSNIQTKYYSPDIHVSSFAIPPYLLDIFKE